MYAESKITDFPAEKQKKEIKKLKLNMAVTGINREFFPDSKVLKTSMNSVFTYPGVFRGS
jgi:hypothetical protein